MKQTSWELTMQSQEDVCAWCAVFAEHLQELMQAALFFSGSEERVEGIVLDALDWAIEHRDAVPSQPAARRFVLRTALHATWRALQPQAAVLAAA
jgi:hypothetical protein